MQLQEVLARIQAHGYGTDTVTQQIQFVNDTYNEVNGKQRWPFLEANDTSLQTTYNINTYSLASLVNLRQLDAVRLLPTDGTADGMDLDYMDPQELRKREVTDASYIAPPAFWTVIDQQLHIWPFPDAVYTFSVDYIITPPELLNETDVSLWPNDYDDILVWGAIRSLAFRERDWLGRQFAQTEFETRLSRMNEEYMVRQRQTSHHVERSGYNDIRPIMPWAVGWS